MFTGLILPVLAVVAALAAGFGYFAETTWLVAAGLGVAAWFVVGWLLYLAAASRLTSPAWLRSATAPRPSYRHATLTTSTLARG